MKAFVPKFNDKLICEKCAKELGAIWPEEFTGTCREGACCVCEAQFKLRDKALCPVDDWDWPMTSSPP